MEYLIVETGAKNDTPAFLFNCAKINLVIVGAEKVKICQDDSAHVFGVSGKTSEIKIGELPSHGTLQKITTNCPLLYNKLCELLRKHYVESVEVVLDGKGFFDEDTVTLTGGSDDE